MKDNGQAPSEADLLALGRILHRFAAAFDEPMGPFSWSDELAGDLVLDGRVGITDDERALWRRLFKDEQIVETL